MLQNLRVREATEIGEGLLTLRCGLGRWDLDGEED
jgi:hypothetical protein